MLLSLSLISCEFHADLLNLKFLGEMSNHTWHIDDICVCVCVL